MFSQYKTDAYSCYMYQANVRSPAPVQNAVDLWCPAADELISSAGHAWTIHGRQWDIMVYESGAGVVATEGRNYPIKSGDLFCLCPGHTYHFHDLPGQPWHYRRIALTGTKAADLLSTIGITPDHPHHPGPSHARWQPLYDEVARTYAKPSVSLATACRLAWQTLETLEQTRTDRAKGWLDKPEERVCITIETQFARPLSIATLARDAGISRTTLYLKFRARFGMSPKEYLDKIRLDHACSLLLQQRRSIKEVAVLCGFASPSYFNQAFRRRFAGSPTQWLQTQSK